MAILPKLKKTKQMKKELTTTVEIITPQVAEEYLKHNTMNRNVSQTVVASYAATMKRGEWRLNGESIKFDTEGRLTDGQHRLLAVVKSGETIQTLVIRNVGTDAFATYDCGRSRTAAQIIGMQGVPNYTIVSGIVSSLSAIRRGLNTYDNTTNSIGGGKAKKMTNEQIIQEFERDRAKYTMYGQRAKAITTKMGGMPIASTMIGATWMHLVEDLGYKQDFVDTFFEQAFSYDTAQIEVVDMFRKRMLAVKMGVANSIYTMQYKINLLHKAWNYYARGETPKALRWCEEEGNISLIPSYQR